MNFFAIIEQVDNDFILLLVGDHEMRQVGKYPTYADAARAAFRGGYELA